VNVYFDYPVERIEITHTAIGPAKAIEDGSQRIGIGPIQFFCLPPIPEPNEDGLIFTKLATPSADVSLCENVSYVFQIYNTNCVPMDVNFSDTLAANMKWLEESLQISDTLSNYQVNSYAGQDTLFIRGLTIPPASSVRISAQAFFNDTATANTVYSNQGLIEYKNFSDQDRSLSSCDRYTLNACAPTSITTSPIMTRAIDIEVVPSSDKSTYSPERDIVIRLKINNANIEPISGVALEVSFNEEFTYLTQPGTKFSNLTGTVAFDLGQGNLNVTNITLPSNEGGLIEFTVKAPLKEGLKKVYDEEGNMLDADGNITDDPDKQAIFPLQVVYSFTYSGSDKCMENAFLNANGEIQVPYSNKARAYIISNKHVTGKGRNN
jgi:hypothetical protein